MAYVYRHIRLDKNVPFYIGIGGDLYKRRAFSRLNRNKHWKNIVLNSEYRVEIILDDLEWNVACQKEIEFISMYGRVDKNTGSLCNLTDGGEGSLNISNSHREKLVQFNLGQKRPQSTRDKLRQMAIGRIVSFETKLKMSEVHKKLNKVHLQQYTKGKSNPRAFKVAQYSINGELIKVWDYGMEAVNSLGLNRTAITDCLKGRQKTAGGFIWKKA